MKHGRSVCQRRGVFYTLLGILFAAAPAALEAQITGDRGSNYAAAANRSGSATGAVTTGSGRTGAPMIRRGELQQAAIVDTGYIEGTSLVSTDMRDADLWARAIIHSDGSYTETKKDEASQTLTQKTMSANGVLLQERVIMADGQGFPSEVLIKDAAGNFKYRGVLLYDRAGRFTEEQLYDMNNQLLRRRIQEYGPGGEPKLRVFDYAKNLPGDIQLVITENTVAGNDTEQARRNYDRFRREAQEVQAGGSAGGNAGAKPKKPGLLKKIFGRKKKT